MSTYFQIVNLLAYLQNLIKLHTIVTLKVAKNAGGNKVDRPPCKKEQSGRLKNCDHDLKSVGLFYSDSVGLFYSVFNLKRGG